MRLALRASAGNDDDRGVLHGPILALADPMRLPRILSGQARTDSALCWSRSDALVVTVSDSASLEVSVTITNLGDTPSAHAALTLVVWGAGESQVGVYRAAVTRPVPAAFITSPGAPAGTLTEIFRLSLPQLSYADRATPISSSDDVTHVFGIVHDAPLDVPDDIASELVQNSRQGKKYFGRDGTHPCRLSRQIACNIPLSIGVFTSHGNAIEHHLAGYADVFVVSTDAGANADFGIYRPVREVFLKNLLNSGSGPHFSGELIPGGPVEFLLHQSGIDLSSIRPENADVIVEHGNADRVTLNWSDTGHDRDKGDYVVAVVHR